MYPLYLARVQRGGVCPIPPGNVTENGQMPEFFAECSDLGNEVLGGFGGMDYTNVKDCNTRFAMTPVCVIIPARANSTAPCVTKLTELMPLTAGGVDAVMALEAPAICPAGYGMVRFRAVPDDRAWYIRKSEPGLFRIEYSCCPTPGQGMCAERTSGCLLEEGDDVGELVGEKFGGDPSVDPQMAVGCNSEMDEIMLGWKITDDGCPAGKRKAVAKCCSVDPHANATAHDADLVRAVSTNADAYKDGNMDSVLDMVETLEDLGEFESPSNSAGVAVDGVYVTEGASFLDPPQSSSKYDFPAYLAKQFDNIREPQILDVTEHARISAAESAVRAKFCDFRSEDMGEKNVLNFAHFLSNCVQNQGEVFSRRSNDNPGNSLLRVRYRVSVGFEAHWQFRMEVHGFTGALVVRRVGQTAPVASMKAKMYSVKHGLLLAALTVQLEEGMYDVEAEPSCPCTPHITLTCTRHDP